MGSPPKPSATLEDIAREVGVSIATVSRALRDSDKINEHTKARVRQVAERRNYVARRRPRPPRSDTPTIELVLPRPQGQDSRISEPFFLDLIGGIGDAMKEAECDFLISHISPSNQHEVTALMTNCKADGVIFVGQGTLHDAYNALTRSGPPFVVWGARLPGQRYCTIGGDNVAGGRRATAHLLRLGRRNIAFLGDTEAPEIALRYQGYGQALMEAGLTANPDLLRRCDLHLDNAQAAVEDLLDNAISFDGILAGNDIVAIGAIRALMMAGRSVPADVSVVGYDDVRLASFVTPSLSTIRQDVTKAGRLLVHKILSQLNGAPSARSDHLPTELVVRESCGG